MNRILRKLRILIAMTMPINRSIVIVSDDVVATAMLSACWARAEKYMTVLESPRMDRPDAENEVVRVLNVIQRIRPRLVLYFGDDPRVSSSIQANIPIPVLGFSKLGELARFGINVGEWSGLTPQEAVQKLYDAHTPGNVSEKCIVYNGSVDVGYVIAANYAILHQAKLLRLDTPQELLKETIDDLNKIDADPVAVREIDVRALKEKLATHLPQELTEETYERILIITEGIPFGLALEGQNVLYANNLMLGYFLAHNIYEHEWGKRERIGLVGLFIADRTVEVRGEYDNFSAAISRTRGLPKRYTTTHPKLAELEIMTLPYDVLYIATHGKQLSGAEEEYELITDDGETHTIIIDRAHGLIGFVAFIKSVDGITKGSENWTIEQGKIWHEFFNRHMYNGEPLSTPVRSTSGITLPMRTLVLGNEPGMNSPFAVQRLASGQRPIVIANACGSWNEMSMRFTFAGAAAYIGTLWAVSSRVANLFAAKLHEGIFEKKLDEAFFDARNSLPENIDKQNYIMTGSFENKYDADTPFSSNGYDEVRERLERNLKASRERLKSFDKSTPKDIKNNTEIDVMLYEKEIKALDEAEEEALGND